MPCGNSSFERPRNRWNRATGFRLPIKACRPPANLDGSVHSLIRFKDIVSNHEHGRVNLQSSKKFKEQTDCIDYRPKRVRLKGKSLLAQNSLFRGNIRSPCLPTMSSSFRVRETTEHGAL